MCLVSTLNRLLDKRYPVAMQAQGRTQWGLRAPGLVQAPGVFRPLPVKRLARTHSAAAAGVPSGAVLSSRLQLFFQLQPAKCWDCQHDLQHVPCTRMQVAMLRHGSASWRPKHGSTLGGCNAHCFTSSPQLHLLRLRSGPCALVLQQSLPMHV